MPGSASKAPEPHADRRWVAGTAAEDGRAAQSTEDLLRRRPRGAHARRCSSPERSWNDPGAVRAVRGRRGARFAAGSACNGSSWPKANGSRISKRTAPQPQPAVSGKELVIAYMSFPTSPRRTARPCHPVSIPVHLDGGTTNHEVGVDRPVVEAALVEARPPRGRSRGNSSRMPAPSSDVERRVLVEEGVAETRPARADARVARRRGRPRRGIVAPSSARSCSRTTSAPALASRPRPTRPPSKRISRSPNAVPASASGFVERTVPSVRRLLGLVKTSSVGMFAT